MEWETVSGGGGTFVKFEEAGQVVSGTLRAVRDGEYGKLYDVVQADGSVLTIPGSHIVNEQLPHLVGRVIRVEFRGKKPTKSGKTVKDFLIQVAPPEAKPLSEVPAALAGDDEDDALPFDGGR